MKEEWILMQESRWICLHILLQTDTGQFCLFFHSTSCKSTPNWGYNLRFSIQLMYSYCFPMYSYCFQLRTKSACRERVRLFCLWSYPTYQLQPDTGRWTVVAFRSWREKRNRRMQNGCKTENKTCTEHWKDSWKRKKLHSKAAMCLLCPYYPWHCIVIFLYASPCNNRR